MIISIGQAGLLSYLVNQLNTFFPDNKPVRIEHLAKSFDKVLQRLEHCFSRINNKYFFDGEQSVFNHLHADQYAMFLYCTSNTLYREEEDFDLCAKVFQLNRLLHGIDAFYEVELPDIFLFVHPLGTVLGRGKYDDYLLVYQKCNVGSNNGIYPVLQKHVSLHPGATVLGDCVIGENCKIGAGALLMDRHLEENSLYFGNPKNFFIKKSDKHNPIWR